MDFGAQPVDYASIIGQGQKLAFSPLDAQQQAAQTGLLNAQTQQQQALVQAAQQKQQRFAQFQTAIHTYDGSATSASKLIAQFPEYADQLKASWDLQDNAKKQSDLTQMGEIYSAASGGNWALAKKLSHQRADAEKAAGYSDPAYDAALEVMDKAADGDPTQQKVVLNLLGTHLAAVTGPDHFGTVYGALNKGDGGYTLPEGGARFDGDNKMVAHSPLLKDADGNIRAWNDGAPTATGGGDPASGGGATGGVQASVAHVLGNEGGLNPSDMNGSPTNFGINYSANKPELAKLGITSPGQMGNLTKDQAAQIYAAKYWPQSGADKLPANLQAPYFDVYVRSPALAKKALKDSGGDPAKFVQITNTAFQNMAANNPKAAPYAKAWATRDAGNAAIATGQAPASAAPSSAPAGFPVLIPGKQATPPTGYRYKPDGSTLEPIPGGPQDPDAQTGALDDPTTTFYAQQILAGAPMPTLGMGKQAAQARQQILKKVATVAGADGLTGKDLAVQIAHYKAGLGNVQNLEKQAGMVEQNEQTALMNGQQFLDRSKELPGQTGYTGLNSIVQTAQRHLPVAGHDTVAAMDAAWNTFTSEYAKVVAGSPSGAGTLSDSARHEQQETMKGNYSYSQKVSAFKQMQADMANRMAAIHGQVAKGYQTLGERAPGLPGSKQAPASGTVRVRSAQEWQALPPGTHYIDPTGVARVKK